MKTLKTAFLSTLAAFGMSGGLYADAYTFTAGTAIPLKENDAQASWVTINNFELQNDYQVGNKQGTSSITLTLNNTSAGDYVLCFDGCNQSKAADLTISASGSSGYKKCRHNTGENRRLVYIQRKFLPSRRFACGRIYIYAFSQAARQQHELERHIQEFHDQEPFWQCA